MIVRALRRGIGEYALSAVHPPPDLLHSDFAQLAMGQSPNPCDGLFFVEEGVEGMVGQIVVAQDHDHRLEHGAVVSRQGIEYALHVLFGQALFQ